MKPPLTFGSLFSGIGGIDLGLERAGMTCKWQVEIDEYAQKVLAKHWPNVARYGDIRTVGNHNLEAVDLLCGGFPCQDISIAGKRAGITGERSGLWKEFSRLICELRPRFVLVENVPALLNWGIDTVLADLAASGYNAEWRVLSAAALGAPHIRERIFIVAYPTSQQDWRIQQRGMESDFATGNQDVAYPNIKRLEIGQIFGDHACQKLTTFKRDCSTGSGQWAFESSVCRMDDGVPHRLDRLRTLGNAVVPQIAQYIGECILATVESEMAV